MYICSVNTDKQNLQIMKKTVNYNGNTIKVEFTTKNFTREIDEMDGIRIKKAHGVNEFNINNKAYVVGWTMNNNKSSSVNLFFEGFACGDSEKKMIEHIISKYGL